MPFGDLLPPRCIFEVAIVTVTIGITRPFLLFARKKNRKRDMVGQGTLFVLFGFAELGWLTGGAFGGPAARAQIGFQVHAANMAAGGRLP